MSPTNHSQTTPIKTSPFCPFSINDQWQFNVIETRDDAAGGFVTTELATVKLCSLQIMADSIKMSFSEQDSGIMIHTGGLSPSPDTFHFDTSYGIAETFISNDTANILINIFLNYNAFNVKFSITQIRANMLHKEKEPFVVLLMADDTLFATLRMGTFTNTTWSLPLPSGGCSCSFKLRNFNGKAINADSLRNAIGK
jgi:hypothetical protein